MLNRAFDRFKALADLKKEVFDEDLDAIVTDESREEDQFKLDHITVTCGSFAVAMYAGAPQTPRRLSAAPHHLQGRIRRRVNLIRALPTTGRGNRTRRSIEVVSR